MPNYLYKCIVCDYAEEHALPISFDPGIKMLCRECENKTGFGEDRMTRRIGKPRVINARQTLGKWFKEQTGKELLGD